MHCNINIWEKSYCAATPADSGTALKLKLFIQFQIDYDTIHYSTVTNDVAFVFDVPNFAYFHCIFVFLHFVYLG